jgi:hypothetical protein
VVKQLPRQARELARDGDSRDLVVAPGADALAEGAQRAGGSHRGVRGFAEHAAGGRRALL